MIYNSFVPIYLDYQASTPLDPQVLEEMEPYLRGLHGNPHSSEHAFGWRANDAVQLALQGIATCLECDPDEILVTSGATEANNLALLGTMRGNKDLTRRRILISPIEHKSVLACAEYGAQELGYEVDLLPLDEQGIVDVRRAKDLIGPDVLLVSLMAVNNEIGSIQPIAEISELSRDHGAFVHCDGAQAPCALPIESLVAHVDFLSLSAHKFYGPQGIGLLFGTRQIWKQIEPLSLGGGQQEGRRSGTLPVALTVGAAAAAMKMKKAREAGEFERIRRLTSVLFEGLIGLHTPISLNGPPLESRHPGNLNLCFHGIEAHDLIMMLQPNVAVSSGSACTSGNTEPSYVLTNIGKSLDDARSSIRFSVGRNTESLDIDRAVRAVRGAIKQLRKQR